jgi:regulator of sigma E protease
MGAFNPGDEVQVRIARNGTLLDFSVILADNEGQPMIGITPVVESEPIPFFEAFSASVGYIGMVGEMILKLFNPATFNEVISQSTSVVGISFEARTFAMAGFLPFIYLAAALSISIGLMNLLPVPPLDGGKIVIETIERIVRRRIPISVMNGISIATMALLIMLIIYLTNQDIQRYIING